MGSWEYNIKGISRVLYRLPKLAAAEQVLVVEGEKDVESLERLGFVATCNPGGACNHMGKWLKNYTESFDGKRVVILPDNDTPGRKHAEIVVQAIRHRVRELRIVRIPIDKDAADWIAGGGTRDAIDQAIAEAAIIAGKDVANDGSTPCPPSGLCQAPAAPTLPQIQVKDRPFRTICQDGFDSHSWWSPPRTPVLRTLKPGGI